MKENRRKFLGASTLTLFGLVPTLHAKSGNLWDKHLADKPKVNGVHPLYPSTDPADVRAVVGAAHTQFEEVKKLVNARPELAKATWDWGFGDVESALGAASHMGRKDIAEYLIEKGARPNIFTFAMLGKLETVKSMIEDMPGIQRIHGPHGFTLLFHAQMRLRTNKVAGVEKERQEALVAYLKQVGDADNRAESLTISEEEKKAYLGKYSFGEGEDEYFDISLNRRGFLYLSRGEYIGRVLNRRDDHIFAPSGGPSVRIHFDMKDGIAHSFTIHDPSPVLSATRV